MRRRGRRGRPVFRYDPLGSLRGALELLLEQHRRQAAEMKLTGETIDALARVMLGAGDELTAEQVRALEDSKLTIVDAHWTHGSHVVTVRTVTSDELEAK